MNDVTGVSLAIPGSEAVAELRDQGPAQMMPSLEEQVAELRRQNLGLLERVKRLESARSHAGEAILKAQAAAETRIKEVENCLVTDLEKSLDALVRDMTIANKAQVDDAVKHVLQITAELVRSELSSVFMKAVRYVDQKCDEALALAEEHVKQRLEAEIIARREADAKLWLDAKSYAEYKAAGRPQ